jgi:hypothetical protein
LPTPPPKKKRIPSRFLFNFPEHDNGDLGIIEQLKNDTAEESERGTTGAGGGRGWAELWYADEQMSV